MPDWQSAPVVGGQAPMQPAQARPVQQQPMPQQQPRRIYGAPETPKPVEPPKPTEVWRTLSADEAVQMGLPAGGTYQVNGTGSVKTIQAPQNSRDGGAIPVSAANSVKESVGQFTALERALGTFKDDFAGNWAGGLENTAQAFSPIPVGTEGQSEWWADFRSTDNLIRNSLFGSALTPGEKKAYEETTISPGMRADKVRANLERRAEIVRGALEREKEFYVANGYKPEAVDALFSPLRQRQAAAQAATPPAFADRQDGVPVASGNGAPPTGPGAAPPPLEPDYRLGSGMSNGNDRENVAVAQGEYRREDNPVLAGVRDEYAQRLAGGQTAEEIIKWAKSAGISPTAFSSIQEQVRFRDANPAVPIQQYDTTQLDDRFVPMSGADQAFNAIGGSALGAGVIGAADAITAGTMDNIIGAAGGNAERARLAMGAVENQNPGSYLAGNVIGGTAAALTGEAALGRVGIQAGLGRALLADTSYGAATGAGNTDDGSSRFVGAAKGAGAAAVGSYLGQRGGNALAGMARGTTTPEVNALMRSGVNDLTLGQTVANRGRVGAAIKGAEDRLSGVPVIGDMINDRRSAGLRQFNSAAFNKVLEPIGGNVGGKVGQEAIADAQEQVSQAFMTALSGKGALPDEQFAKDLAQSVENVRSVKRLGDEVGAQVDEIMLPYGDEGLLSGEALDDISRGLRGLKANYVKSGDPLATTIGKRIDAVERAVFDLFDRQASGTIGEYRKARAAYRRLSIVEDAVLKAQNQTDQVFTPAQLGRSDTGNAKKFTGKGSAARGDTPFNELTTNAQAVLPNKVPDSGTVGRLLIPLVALGGGGAADQYGGTGGNGITIGAIIAGAYTRTGQRILTKGARGMKEGPARRVLENQRTGRALGVTGAAGSASLLGGQQ